MLFETTLADPARAAKLKASFLGALGCEDNWSRVSWPLPNAKEVTESEFWNWRPPTASRPRFWAGQERYEDRWGHLLVYWLDHGHLLKGGFAVLVLRNDYPKPSTIRYFEWRACAHEFGHRSTGNCQHLYTCKKCGASYEVDSSG